MSSLVAPSTTSDVFSTKLEQVTPVTSSSSSETLKPTISSSDRRSFNTETITTVSQTAQPGTRSHTITVNVIIGSIFFVIMVVICVLVMAISLVYIRKWRKIFAKGLHHSPSIGDDYDIDSITLSHLSTAPPVNFQSGVMIKVRTHVVQTIRQHLSSHSVACKLKPFQYGLFWHSVMHYYAYIDKPY